MRKTVYFVLVLLTACVYVSCKTNEKNYRLAYDKAKEKAQAGLTAEEYEMMTLNALPPYQRTATDSVRVFSESVMWQYTPESVDSGRKMKLPMYNLAVGKYTMLTNAKAHADRLAADGWRSLVVRNGEPVYYVIVKQSKNLDTIAAAAHQYVKQYPSGTVSLHEPMALRPHRIEY